MGEKSVIRRADVKWCIGCKAYHLKTVFGSDKSRYDGLASKCKKFKRDDERARYTPKPRPQKGRRFVEVRENDKKQARRRVNYLVEANIIRHPNEIPCTDCGHVYEKGERRHEYDHHKGYKKEFHQDVQSVCSVCHKKRTNGK